MTKKETVMLFGIIAALYPKDDRFAHPDATMRDAWHEMLEDIPFDVVRSAIKASAATSPYIPHISEIRDYATRLTGERRLTADEAWGVACEMLRTYGLNMVYKEGYVPAEEPPAKFGEPIKVAPNPKEYEAKRHCPKDVWEILEHLGYRDVYMSENPDVVRGQFMRAWSNHDKEEYEKRVIGGVLPQFLKDLNLLGDGQNGELTE